MNSFGPSDSFLVNQFLTTLSKYTDNSLMKLFEVKKVKNNTDISILEQSVCYKVSDTLTFNSEQNTDIKTKASFSSIKIALKASCVKSWKPSGTFKYTECPQLFRHRPAQTEVCRLLSQTKPHSQHTSLQRCSLVTLIFHETRHLLQMKQMHLVSISVHALAECFKKLSSVWGNTKLLFL